MNRIVRTAIVVASVWSVAAADVLRVPSAEYATIQRAIDFAQDGDTVLVEPGEYLITEPLDFNRLHDPDNPASPPLKNIVVRAGMDTLQFSPFLNSNPDEMTQSFEAVRRVMDTLE